ncbi:MAG TPA: DinB family protein [Bacillota bacterium]|nr:DinB family protein [Bacillota bacterium]
MNAKIINACQTHFFFSFSMLEKLIEACPEDTWDLKAGGFVFWQQLLHALSGINFWMRSSPEPPFIEPFRERNVYPELEQDPEGKVTRAELLEYKDDVKGICVGFFLNKDDEWLCHSSPIYDQITNLDVVFMQIRHIQYHVGHCNSILRDRNIPAVDWIDYWD